VLTWVGFAMHDNLSFYTSLKCKRITGQREREWNVQEGVLDKKGKMLLQKMRDGMGIFTHNSHTF
jgi:hypothetical protein